MSSNIPIVRQFAWASLPPQLLVIGSLSIIANFIGLNDFLFVQGLLANVLWGCAGQILIWVGVRRLVAKYNKRGIELAKQGKYKEAIFFFMKSYDLFSKYLWIDKYRYYLISTSKISYREMDLNNIAFCYGQIGEKEKSIEFYKRTIIEFPQSGIANAALNFIKTLEGFNTK